MPSKKTFCVRWITLITAVSAILIPVSRATASSSPACPAAEQQVTAHR